MYTFLFAVDAQDPQLARRVERGAEITAQLLPHAGQGTSLRAKVTRLPELGVAWMTITPELDTQHLICEHVDDDVAALVFGEIGALDSAAGVAAAFASDGVEAVRTLPGEYCAVIVDRRARRVFLVGDVIGRRSALYFVRETLLAISPHAVTLASTGLCPLELDLVSAASILGAESSLDGKPLCSTLSIQHPWELLEWHEGALARHVSAHLVAEDRIAARDSRRIESTLATIQAHMLDNARQRAESRERIRCSLTAGMDSRAVFALLCRSFDPSCIETFTVGGPENLDVSVAARIAAMVGSPHTRVDQDTPSVDNFEDNVRTWAFHMNGDINAKRALGSLAFDPKALLVANGVGGEVFRGAFYRFFGLTTHVPDRVEDIEATLHQRAFRRLSLVRFEDEALRAGVRARLREILERYAAWSSDGHDIIDYYYLLNRYARWGSITARAVWSPSWTPYSDSKTIIEMFRLPAPIGKYCPIHARLVRDYLPAAAYAIPINGGPTLAMEGIGKLNYARRQLARLRAVAIDKLRQRVQQTSKSIETQRAELLAGPLFEPLRDTLMTRGSTAEQLLGRRQTEALLGEHQRRCNHMQLLGFLLSMDAWRALYDEADRRGREADEG